MSDKKSFMWLYVSIASFFLLSVSFLLMPIDFTAWGMQILDLLIGIMFWVFLVLGIAAQVILGHTNGKRSARNCKRRTLTKKRIGLISFFQNLPACFADVLLVISLIGLIASVVVTKGMGYACYVFWAMLVFSFCMHCILNGKIYYFLANQRTNLKTSQHRRLD